MDQRVRSAIRLMERGMDEELSVKDVARQLDLSVHHFHRLFVDEVGEPPATFLRRIRMDEAGLRLKWGSESTGTIAYALGFQSRPAFIRAFTRRFGVTPSQYRKDQRKIHIVTPSVDGDSIGFQEIDGLSLIGRRYRGDVFCVREHWQDFFETLPPEFRVRSRKTSVGLLYDDFRITQPDKVRYDCCIILNEALEQVDSTPCTEDLQSISIRSGRYATIRHRGPYWSVSATYERFCAGWLVPNGHVLAAAPAIEIHSVPRHLQDPDDLDVTLMIGLE